MPSSSARRLALTTLSALLLAAALPAARAADYPARPVELVVAAAAGGGTDVMARAFAESARKHFTQPLLIVNKPGAASAIGFADVAAAKPDGYKLGVISVNLAILPALNLARFTADDFIPIARLNSDPAAITVRAEAPWKTIEEFIADAKRRPREIQVGNAGIGDIWHVAAAALEDRTGTHFNHVPFQGASPGVVSLLGGHIDAVAVSPGEVVQHVLAGKLRTLAVMADERLTSPAFAAVPTLKERKIDLSIGAWRGLAVPKGTPAEVVTAWRHVARDTSAEPAFQEALAKANLGPAYLDADAFRAAIERDRQDFKSVLSKLVIEK